MENILRLELIISYFINWTSTIICFQFGILLLSCFMGTRCVLFIFSTPVQEIEYLCPFKVIYWTSNLLCDGIGGRAIMNRISAIRKVSQESSLAPFCRVMLQWEDGYQRGSQLSPGTKFVCTSWTFQPPGLWERNSCCVEATQPTGFCYSFPNGLRYQVMTVPYNTVKD